MEKWEKELYEIERLYDKKIDKYNNLMSREFRKVLDEMKNKHYYAPYIDDKNIEKMTEKDRREFLKTELEEALTYLTEKRISW